jgi:hypothetical protein
MAGVIGGDEEDYVVNGVRAGPGGKSWQVSSSSLSLVLDYLANQCLGNLPISQGLILSPHL